MAKRRSVEERLERLSALRRERDRKTVRREIAAGLKESFLVAARAAEVAAELMVGDLVEELETAFDRFLQRPQTDKGCAAKLAIARGAFDLGEPAGELFLCGSRHVQLEPAYGGPVDVAADLRSISAHGLARLGSPPAVSELARLLEDPEPSVRAAAARALGSSGRLEAEPLLRLKVHAGDREPEVLIECLESLLHLEPRRSLPFVARLLEPPPRHPRRRPPLGGDEARAQAAALALGGSRLAEAVEVLWRAFADEHDPETRRTLLLALSMTRRPQVIEALLEMVARAEPATAAAALDALVIHRRDEAVYRAVKAALAAPGVRPSLRARFRQEFERG